MLASCRDRHPRELLFVSRRAESPDFEYATRSVFWGPELWCAAPSPTAVINPLSQRARTTNQTASQPVAKLREVAEMNYPRTPFRTPYTALSSAPPGMTPSSTKCHSAISRRLATATMPTRRCRLPASANRLVNQSVIVLVGCSRTQLHASWMAMRRMRRLPALLMPCSFDSLPLLCGEPPKPAAPASSRLFAKLRHPKNSSTNGHALWSMPTSVASSNPAHTLPFPVAEQNHPTLLR